MATIKVSDFIAQFLAEHKDVAKSIFMVSGGGNMHLIDSLGKESRLKYICNHNEQACTIASEGIARLTNKIGVAYVTTGPGGTNAISGVYGAWVDSIPTLTISGQVKFSTTIASEPSINLRQKGDQECNIIDLVKPITKYATMITDKNEIKYHLQKAIYEAKSLRPGPVWLDIPLDIQGASIDTDDLKEYTPPLKVICDSKIDSVIDMLLKSKRPVFLLGNGIALSGAKMIARKLINMLKIPVMTTFSRFDIIESDCKYYCGRPGSIGNRAANFAIQNADLLICIGASLSIRVVSYNWEYFSRESKKIMVDIDPNEMDKNTISIDLKINCDAKEFINLLLNKVDIVKIPSYQKWLDKVNIYKENYPTLESHRKKVKNIVDSYYFFDTLSYVADDNAVFVLGNGTACVSSFQSLKIFKHQKAIMNSGSASMGYDLPASIGACYGNDKKDVICVTGEGSIQMNIQELQTIVHNNLPIKIFVFNNGGYISIRNTQNNFFNGRMVGSGAESGVSFPDMSKISKAYGIKFYKIKNQINLASKIRKVLNTKGIIICEVILNPNEKMEPKLSSIIKENGTMISKPLEDMYPFINREEFKSNMIVKTINDD